MSSGSKKGGGDIPSEGTGLAEPIAYYKLKTGKYPSNGQIWWAYRRPLEVGTDSPPKTYIEVFDPSLRFQITLGNSPAPKGHYVLDAFHQDRSGRSGVAGIDVKSSRSARPSACAFLAGRVFYAGVNVAGWNTKIYFTQVLERPEQVQECYQTLDPTNEDVRDLLPTDGGVIVVPEVSEVYHLQTMGHQLYVFGRNGVWQIGGSEGIGFRANDYSVQKISGTPAISNLSFVDVEGSPVWWNRSGIYTVRSDQLGNSQVVSLTEDSIKEFFDDIPETSKFYAKGAYDNLTKRVQWLYRSTEPVSDFDNYKYDRILVLDTNTGAFWHYEPESSDRIDMKGIFAVEGFAVEQEQVEVLVDDDPVLVDAEEVYSVLERRVPVQSKIKYVINIKDDTVDAPATPDPVEESTTEDVYVNADAVLVDADQVQVVLE